MSDGRGDPSTSTQYREAVEALFSVSYGLKFAVKRKKGIDYGVMPLEGLWWVEEGKAFERKNRNSWLWTAMIYQPEWVTAQLFAEILQDVQKKKPLALAPLRMERLVEGKSIQIMHRGPYSEEDVNVTKLHLNSPDRTAPAKLRTILRQPVR